MAFGLCRQGILRARALFEKYGNRTSTGQKMPMKARTIKDLPAGARNQHGAFRPAIVPQQYF
jgi:hypothetical protein